MASTWKDDAQQQQQQQHMAHSLRLACAASEDDGPTRGRTRPTASRRSAARAAAIRAAVTRRHGRRPSRTAFRGLPRRGVEEVHHRPTVAASDSQIPCAVAAIRENATAFSCTFQRRCPSRVRFRDSSDQTWRFNVLPPQSTIEAARRVVAIRACPSLTMAGGRHARPSAPQSAGALRSRRACPSELRSDRELALGPFILCLCLNAPSQQRARHIA